MYLILNFSLLGAFRYLNACITDFLPILVRPHACWQLKKGIKIATQNFGKTKSNDRQKIL